MPAERVYGLHTVRSLLTRAPQRVRKLWLQQGRDGERIAQIEALARASQRPIERADRARLRAWLGEVAHQGVMAEIDAMAPLREDDLYTQLAGAPDPLVLALDGVQDPHNLGACLRTADAAGAHAVVIPRDRAAAVDGVVRKVAAGAAEFVPVASVTNLARALDMLKERGIWVVGTDGEAPQSLYAADLKRPLALVLGAEGSGMRRLTRERCDFLVRIPMAGQVESLNVSVAAGVALLEARRQRT